MIDHNKEDIKIIIEEIEDNNNLNNNNNNNKNLIERYLFLERNKN